MATVRLIVVLLVLGAVVLLGVQNLAPTLPLVFLGGSTQTLPLGIWLVGATLLGALTTLVLTALLGSLGGGPGNRSTAYKYRPQSFYEPAEAAAAPSGPGESSRRNTPPPYTTPGPRGTPQGGGSAPNDDPSWRDWTSLKSPGQWNDWESLSEAPKPETASATSTTSGLIDGVTTWFSSSKQRAKQQQRVNESLRELDHDWGEMEQRPYTAPGVSPVQDNLDDINQGWEHASNPNRNFEASQAPRQLYRDGSLYSYSYRDEDQPSPRDRGQVDNIYAPPDDVLYSDRNNYPDPNYGTDHYEPDYSSDYSAGEADDDRAEHDGYDNVDRLAFDEAAAHTPLGEPEMAEDGVVDADYRVIVPPYTAAAEAAATSVTWAEGSDDESPSSDRDDWDAADDALTP